MVNYRCQELNLPLCRLALFLDPRYKGHVDDGHGLDGLVTTVLNPRPSTSNSIPGCTMHAVEVVWG